MANKNYEFEEKMHDLYWEIEAESRASGRSFGEIRDQRLLELGYTPNTPQWDDAVHALDEVEDFRWRNMKTAWDHGEGATFRDGYDVALTNEAKERLMKREPIPFDQQRFEKGLELQLQPILDRMKWLENQDIPTDERIRQLEKIADRLDGIRSYLRETAEKYPDQQIVQEKLQRTDKGIKELREKLSSIRENPKTAQMKTLHDDIQRLEKRGIGLEKIEKDGALVRDTKTGETGRIPWAKDEFGMYRLKANDVEWDRDRMHDHDRGLDRGLER